MPFGRPWAPFWSLSGSLLVPFGSICLPFDFLLLVFGVLLAPFTFFRRPLRYSRSSWLSVVLFGFAPESMLCYMPLNMRDQKGPHWCRFLPLAKHTKIKQNISKLVYRIKNINMDINDKKNIDVYMYMCTCTYTYIYIYTHHD